MRWALIGMLALAALLVPGLSAAGPAAVDDRAAVTPTPTTVPFLHPPFARKHRVTSFFDHRLPDRAWDDTIVIFDGKQASAIDGMLDRTATFRGGYWFPDESWYVYYDGHNAFDYGTGAGKTILAAAPGEVIVARAVPSSCDTPLQYVCLQHANGYRTYYLHLEGIAVREGAWVETGDPLGISGNSGCSLGPHLHFGVEHNGWSTDPYGWSPTDRADPLIAFSGHAATWLWVPEEPPLAAGELADPPKKTAVHGGLGMSFLPDGESPPLERVEFLAFYGDQWHSLGSDVDGTDGWTWTWDTDNAPEGEIWLHAWAVDRQGRVGKGSPIRTDIVVDRSPPEGAIVGLAPESTAGSRLWLYVTSRDRTSGTAQVTFLIRPSAAEGWQEIGQAQEQDAGRRETEDSRDWFLEWGATEIADDAQIDLIARLVDRAGNTSWTLPVKGVTIDHDMPGGALLVPQSGSPIAGATELAFSPDPDASPIEQVDFYVWYDGGWHRAGMDQDGGDGWSVWWDPANVADQRWLRVQARVYDARGAVNTALPQATGLVLDRTPPSAGYIRPASGGVARPDVAQQVWATDQGSGVAGVEFFVNQGRGWLKIGEDRDAQGGWSLLWDAHDVPDGVVDFTARVYDRAGNEAWTTDVRNVALDRTPPEGGFSFPEPGTELGSAATLALNVTDAVSGLDRAIFYARYDGHWHHLGADLTHQDGLGITWDTSALGRKEEVGLTAWVYDRAGNYAEIPYVEGLSLGEPGRTEALPSSSVTPTLVPSPTAPSPTASPSRTPTVTMTATRKPTPSKTAVPTPTPSPSPTPTPTGTPTATATAPPTPTETPQPTATARPSPTAASSAPEARPVSPAFWYLIGSGVVAAFALLIRSIHNLRRRDSSSRRL